MGGAEGFGPALADQAPAPGRRSFPSGAGRGGPPYPSRGGRAGFSKNEGDGAPPVGLVGNVGPGETGFAETGAPAWPAAAVDTVGEGGADGVGIDGGTGADGGASGGPAWTGGTATGWPKAVGTGGGTVGAGETGAPDVGTPEIGTADVGTPDVGAPDVDIPDTGAGIPDRPPGGETGVSAAAGRWPEGAPGCAGEVGSAAERGTAAVARARAACSTRSSRARAPMVRPGNRTSPLASWETNQAGR
ncbi:hypothetical protein Prubr_21790 [Polymorphospora rubra]|uniref:Uncharacterized protein n=1 Tax=Polymorphospora rubra TaxID=338584 RepID=A0A810N0I2_9ACTN|nr:hypothetical protein Prubr_21790 [Polymorphospora rubra]